MRFLIKLPDLLYLEWPSLIGQDLLYKSHRNFGRQFGYQIDSKGFRVLNDKIRVIQGDCVNYFSIKEILRALLANRWSANNISFGMEETLLQKQ